MRSSENQTNAYGSVTYYLVYMYQHNNRYIYFINSMRTTSTITGKTFGKKSMATFLANEINATDRDVTGPAEQVRLMFPLKHKNIN